MYIQKIGGRRVKIQSPPNAIGTLLLLHGWNFEADYWCDSSNLCRIALNKGIRVVSPDMGKSIYAGKYYNQTHSTFRKEPLRSYITHILIPYLRDSAGWFRAGENNFISGISTGAHGAALIIAETGQLFSAGALLSGDYNQTYLKEDRIYKSWYGNYSLLWDTIDNPSTRISSIKIPLLLFHGRHDPVVPYSQSQNFYTALKRYNNLAPVELFIYEKGLHNFSYWEKESNRIVEYFIHNMKSNKKGD